MVDYSNKSKKIIYKEKDMHNFACNSLNSSFSLEKKSFEFLGSYQSYAQESNHDSSTAVSRASFALKLIKNHSNLGSGYQSLASSVLCYSHEEYLETIKNSLEKKARFNPKSELDTLVLKIAKHGLKKSQSSSRHNQYKVYGIVKKIASISHKLQLPYRVKHVSIAACDLSPLLPIVSTNINYKKYIKTPFWRKLFFLPLQSKTKDYLNRVDKIQRNSYNMEH